LYPEGAWSQSYSGIQDIADFLHSSDTGEKSFEYNETVHQLFIDFKKAYDSVRREVL
jgi:hypothetical protein